MNMAPRSRWLPLLLTGVLLLAGCAPDDAPDAHGTFEADAVTVSSETDGQLVRFTVEEGDRLAGRREHGVAMRTPESARVPDTARSVVGLVDTTRLALQRRELRARKKSLRSTMATVSAEIDVLREQRRAAERELERMRTLRAGDAAPQRQVDQAADEVRVLQRRIEATRSRRASLADEIKAVNEQIAQVDERIQNSWIENPVGGTVLATYAEAGEIVRAGTPLYKIAPLDTLTLRAYVSGAQLSSVRIGQSAQVFIDTGDETQASRPGRVTWVASEAEFTPTPIQTREERVDFVYAVKLRVPNPDGALKIGMPADVSFQRGGTETDAPTASAGPAAAAR